MLVDDSRRNDLSLARDCEDTALEELMRRLGSVDEELARLRMLIVRAYEDTQRAAVEVLKMRRRQSYRDAYANRPLVTVRIGAYMAGDLLFDRALHSVRLQSYDHWEAIIVCDGPDEATAARIAGLRDPRIRCVQRPRNGPYVDDRRSRWQVAGSHPFNEGVALAQGSWIAPIDQDDEWTEDHLDILLADALRTKAEVVYGVGRVEVADVGETYFGVWPPVVGDFGFQAAIYHADLVAFLYDANAYLADEPADWNLARRMLEAGVRFQFVERIVTAYYLKGDMDTIDWWRDRCRQRGRFMPSRVASE